MDPTTDICTSYPPLGADRVPLAFPEAWRTEAVLGVAFGIRADDAFDRMPILADALEEAGCDDTGMLNHCRHCTHHRPDCWVIECVLPGDHELWLDAVAIAAGRTPEPAANDQPIHYGVLVSTPDLFPVSARLLIVGVVVLVAFGLFQVVRTLLFVPPPAPPATSHRD